MTHKVEHDSLFDPITSASNTWVQQCVRIHRTKERYREKRFLIEGEHSVLEAILADWPLILCFATPHWLESHAESSRRIREKCNLQLVSEKIMSKIASTESPDGVLAIGEMRNPGSGSQLPSLGIAVDRLQDPGNLGTLIRSSIACDVDGIYLSEGCVDPFSPKVIRSTAGQWFRKPPIPTKLAPWLKNCQQQGVRVLSATANGTPFWEIDLTQPLVFVVGNEGGGISDEILALSDEIVSIPMQNQVESLNAAMTGTLLLYEAVRQRRKSS